LIVAVIYNLIRALNASNVLCKSAARTRSRVKCSRPRAGIVACRFKARNLGNDGSEKE
jgi:hypothetical protein